ncbi:MAG: diphthamide biosynthesis enzyme Dph2 [Thermoplasmata archaeon]|nr:MAG: diphthamide biosynthesis enzyme Dph2 [Thermoplasmata archaeon]
MLELGEFTIDLSKLVDECKTKMPTRLAVQIPPALQRHSAELSKAIADNCLVDVFMISRPSFGACDLPDFNKLKELGVDLLVNLGHTELPNIKSSYEEGMDIPVLFLEMPAEIEKVEIAPKDLKRLGKSVALSATVQYVHLLPKVAEFLEENDIQTHIGEGDGRIKYNGQVLGCNYTAVENISKKIDSHLFVGTGIFHPLGIALAVEKPVFALDPHLGVVINFEGHRERFLRKRFGLIEKAKASDKFGVVICTKPGQLRKEVALESHEMLKKQDKTSVLFISNELDPSDFDYSDIDVIVSTACPRIALDDSSRYKKPIITPLELKIALGEHSWEDYLPDSIKG